MFDLLKILFGGGGIGVIILIAIIALVVKSSFVSASPGEIKVISGGKGQRSLIGKTGWKVPIVERVDSMTANMISVDVKTTDAVPTHDIIEVNVDAAVKVRIGTEDPKLFEAATRNFLYKSTEDIADEVRDTLEGHLRAIIGQMDLIDIIQDRSSFSEKVQENAMEDLAEMGLVIVAFNIQGLSDTKDVIDQLGTDNTEQIKKKAAIAKAHAVKDVALVESETHREANDARIKAELEIQQKNTDLILRQAELKAKSDKAQATADAVREIEAEIQRKEIEAKRAEAEIKKQEQAVLIEEQKALVEQQRLKAEVEAQATAELFKEQKQAEAEAYKQKKQAEAEAYTRKQQAEAEKQALIAEAEGIRAKGLAEADSIGAKLKAEAEGLEAKAEAMAKMNQAAVLEMYFNALPEVAKHIAEPLNNVSNITMYGEGNSAKMVGDITNSLSQVQSAVGESIGIDLKDVLSTFTGVKMATSGTLNQIEEPTPIDTDINLEDIQ